MFPKELLYQKRWVGYKANKLPIDLKTGKIASSTDPITWSYYYEGKKNVRQFNCEGMGVVLTPPYVGIDLDDCIDLSGRFSKFSKNVIQSVNSYTEYSPSKTGVHILCRGQILKSYKSKEIEIYNQARYFTVTKNIIQPWYGLLPNRTKELLKLIPHQLKESSYKNSAGWIVRSLDNLKPGNFHNEQIKIIGRLHYDRWAPDDIYALLKPHAERCRSDLVALRQRIESITRYKNTVLSIDDIPEEPASDLLKQEFKREWVIKPFFPKNKICIIGGIQETGKSWLLLDLAIEASRGGRWLDVFPVHQEKVLYIDQERSKDETGTRVKKLCEAKGLSKLPNLTFSIGSSIRLNIDRSYEAFKKKLQTGGYTLVLVDSLVKFHTSDDNTRQGMYPVMERLHQLRNELGITFVLLEHEGKNILSPEKMKEEPNALDLIGSSAKPQAVESVLTVRPRGDKLGQVFHTKATCGSKGESFKFEIIDIEPEKSTIVRII